MKAEDVLTIVRREMTAIGTAWRLDWSDFDGRSLRDQLSDLDTFAGQALESDEPVDYREGTEFLEERLS